jgi:hypothetical protein
VVVFSTHFWKRFTNRGSFFPRVFQNALETLAPLYLPCRKCSTNHWHAMRHWMSRFCFWDLLPTQSRRAKFLKPGGGTTQFSAEMHCQARNQRRTELVSGHLSSHGFAVLLTFLLVSGALLACLWASATRNRSPACELLPTSTTICRAPQHVGRKKVHHFLKRTEDFVGWANVEKLLKKLWDFLYYGMGVGAGWVNELLKEGCYILQRWNKRQVHAESSLIISNPE